MSTTVHVSNISHQTSEHEVRDFFSFCGKITSLSVTPTSDAADSTKSATVTFEKETAAKTALLLDNTQLGTSHVKVEAGPGLAQIAGGKTASSDDSKDGDLEQEDKPRSRILAEYLAHGYVIGDSAIQKAIELDHTHGVSSRFTHALQNFDDRFKATDRAKSADASYGVTDKAYAGWRGLQSYFEKALETPTGQRLRNFYTMTERQVLDIHNEARHLADLRKDESGGGENKPTQVSGSDKTTYGQGHSATGPAADVAAGTHLAPLGSNLPGEATGAAADISASTGIAPVGEKKY
ncbi:MAG: hypothetical protein M1826_004591 [Phylliscum demangeonii]|nr:MAG: hypothetical protein M1826_004591 [Phylliscum demangeonii]